MKLLKPALWIGFTFCLGRFMLSVIQSTAPHVCTEEDHTDCRTEVPCEDVETQVP